MAADENWRRWIHASVGTQLSTVATDAQTPYLVEGINDRHDSFNKAPDRVEIRLNGPYTRQLSGNIYLSRVFVNVLVASVMGETRDPYLYDSLLGKYHKRLSSPIEVLKLGVGGVNDGTSIGCLHNLTDRSNAVRVIDFGEINPTTRLRQGMVSANYEIELKGT